MVWRKISECHESYYEKWIFLMKDFRLLISMFVYLIRLGLCRIFVCGTICFKLGLIELNVIIPLMVHDKLIINCGLHVEQGV